MPATQLKTQAIADAAISTPKIGDAQVTQPKLAPGVGGNVDHSFRLLKSAVQSIPNAISTAITWDVESFDTDNLHAPSSDIVTITAGTAGKWQIGAEVFIAGNSSGQRFIQLFKNGGQIAIVVAQPPGANNHPFQAHTLIDLAAGDFLQVQFYQDSGVALNTGSNSRFYGIRVAS